MGSFIYKIQMGALITGLAVKYTGILIRMISLRNRFPHRSVKRGVSKDEGNNNRCHITETERQPYLTELPKSPRKTRNSMTACYAQSKIVSDHTLNRALAILMALIAIWIYCMSDVLVYII